MTNVEQVLDFLNNAKTYYVATVEDDQPRVRPFGAHMIFEDKLYLVTNNQKACFKQMIANPKVEVCGMAGGKWIRIAGKLVLDDRLEARAAMLEKNPGLGRMYKADDGLMEVLYFEDATATISSFVDAPVELKF